MLTPFTDKDRVDVEVLDRYVDWLIDHGAAGLFPVALSGEMYEMDEGERLQLAARVAARARGRVPVAAAVAEGHSSDAAAIAVAVERLAATGVDVVVLVASVVLAEGDEEARLRDVVETVIARNPDVMLGIYECPLPYHRVLSEDTVAWLAGTGRFAFFKETSHDVGRMRERVRIAGDSGMRIFNAGIENLAESVQVGVAGLSGWIANVYPDAVAKLCGLASEEGPTERVLALQHALAEVEQRMSPGYPGSAKLLVEARAGIGFRPESRWRPSLVDPAEVEEIIARFEATDAVAVR